MPIPASILERVETFGRNLDSYLDPDYKETQLRREFLDPLFEALGWDVANKAGYAEAYKDVVHEDSLKVPGLAATAPDYSFRVGGTRKFFVEAKKPAVKIKDDPAPAAQLRSYQLYELTPEEIALVEQATAPAAAPPAAESEPAPAPKPPPPPGAYVQAEAEAAHHFFVKEEPPSSPSA
jgi:hypothetical protein